MRIGLTRKKIPAAVGFGYVLIVPLAAGALFADGERASNGAGVQSAFAVTAVIWVSFALIAYERLHNNRAREFRAWIARSICLALVWPFERLFELGWVYGFSATGADHVFWTTLAAWFSLLFALVLGQYLVLQLDAVTRSPPFNLSTRSLAVTGDDLV